MNFKSRLRRIWHWTPPVFGAVAVGTITVAALVRGEGLEERSPRGLTFWALVIICFLMWRSLQAHRREGSLTPDAERVRKVLLGVIVFFAAVYGVVRFWPA